MTSTHTHLLKLIVGRDEYVPAQDPTLEVFRTKPEPVVSAPIATEQHRVEPVDDSGIVADENAYHPALNPDFEVFRTKPGNESTPVAKYQKPEAVDESGIISDERAYHPAPDPRLEVFRTKP